MTIRLIKQNNYTYKYPSFKQEKETKSYLDKEGAIDTTELTHPLSPEGHLVNDSFSNSFKYL